MNDASVTTIGGSHSRRRATRKSLKPFTRITHRAEIENRVRGRSSLTLPSAVAISGYTPMHILQGVRDQFGDQVISRRLHVAVIAVVYHIFVPNAAVP